MPEECQPFDPGFSTADAEYPMLELRDGVLTIAFVDWQEERICVKFDDVMAVKWQETGALLQNEPFDGACVVEDSTWLEQHLVDSRIGVPHSYRHLKFNFNACGSLEVLCAGFRQEIAIGS
jgi:hypothetical protein